MHNLKHSERLRHLPEDIDVRVHVLEAPDLEGQPGVPEEREPCEHGHGIVAEEVVRFQGVGRRARRGCRGGCGGVRHFEVGRVWSGGEERREGEIAEKLLEILPRVRWGRCGLGGRSGQNIFTWGIGSMGGGYSTDLP